MAWRVDYNCSVGCFGRRSGRYRVSVNDRDIRGRLDLDEGEVITEETVRRYAEQVDLADYAMEHVEYGETEWEDDADDSEASIRLITSTPEVAVWGATNPAINTGPAFIHPVPHDGCVECRNNEVWVKFGVSKKRYKTQLVGEWIDSQHEENNDDNDDDNGDG